MGSREQKGVPWGPSHILGLLRSVVHRSMVLKEEAAGSWGCACQPAQGSTHHEDTSRLKGEASMEQRSPRACGLKFRTEKHGVAGPCSLGAWSAWALG